MEKKSGVMDKIRENLTNNSENNFKKQPVKNNTSFFSKGIRVAAVLVILTSISFTLYQGYKFKKEKKITMINHKADSLMKSLDFYYDVNKRYPSNLNDELILEMSNFEKDIAEIVGAENQYQIEISDFAYNSDGQSYEFCFKNEDYKNCWSDSR